MNTREKGKGGGGACIVTEPSSARERILNAAFGAFVERGYAGASTLEIATRAKVSKRELYAHFRNKQALLAAGIEGRTKRMQVPMALPEIADKTALASVLKAFGVAILAGVTDPDVLAVYRLAIAESVQSPELAATLDREGRKANRRALTDLLAKARLRHMIADCDVDEMAEEFIGLLWTDLMPLLLLRLVERPSKKQIERRAGNASQAFLALHGTEAE